MPKWFARVNAIALMIKWIARVVAIASSLNIIGSIRPIALILKWIARVSEIASFLAMTRETKKTNTTKVIARYDAILLSCSKFVLVLLLIYFARVIAIPSRLNWIARVRPIALMLKFVASVNAIASFLTMTC